MPATLGSVTTTIIEHLEAHKLHLEFESSGVLVAGDLVSLVTADATVETLANSADADVCVGIAITDALDTEMVTVAMKGWAVVMGESEAATLIAGPAEAGPFNATTGRREYLTSSAVDKTVGWNILNATSDGGDVRIVLKA